MSYFVVTWLFISLLFSSGESTSLVNIKAFPVFGKDEIEFHKYSAILAASEPLRILRDKELKALLNPIGFYINKLKGPLLAFVNSSNISLLNFISSLRHSLYFNYSSFTRRYNRKFFCKEVKRDYFNG